MNPEHVHTSFYEAVVDEALSTLSSSRDKAHELAEFSTSCLDELSKAVGHPGFNQAVVSTRNRIERKAATLIEEQSEEIRRSWINGLGVALRISALALKGIP